jgi:hypothetical protein
VASLLLTIHMESRNRELEGKVNGRSEDKCGWKERRTKNDKHEMILCARPAAEKKKGKR